MTRVVIRGESVYECDVCKRKERTPTIRQGLDVMPRCNITSGCRGHLHRITALRDINNTPATTPEVEGLADWFQRNVLYTHQQPVRSDTWTVIHNLQNIPNVNVFVHREIDGVQTLVPKEPTEVVTIDANTTELRFASAESGQVQFVSLRSKNTVNYTSQTQSVDIDSPVSSSNGEVTIATMDSAVLVDITITFIAATPVVVTYPGVDTIPSINSAWSGVDGVIVNGKRYTARSFNIKDGTAAQLLAAGTIPSGTPFSITGVNGTPPQAKDVLFLLSTTPHAYTDRVYNQYIDSTQVSSVSPEMYYASGTVSADPSIIKPTYPLILVV